MSTQWQRVKEVFEQACALSVGERAAYLATSCPHEPEVRREVESLLSSYEPAREFLEKPALDDSAERALEPLPHSWAGRRIGSYELVTDLGHGGMGSVYLAIRRDDQFQKRVAIKLIKRGMDTDAIIRRFRNERQILASMDHPNIAKLVDAGVTSDGLPYFVMELIEGRPITEYCDVRRLSIRARLLLFQIVCAAVQHAHRNLIVHRDIKPGNILVTAEGIPKLLDFGVAKLLNPELGFSTLHPTVAELRMFTPAYASPEQIRGESITTASDVYSLGVVLQELLSGAVPGSAPSGGAEAGASERTALLRDSSPDSLRRQLHGDLDNIVLKALRAEPQRRYGSADQLSEDIRRHLEGLPVSARKDTFGYRAGKFLGRHKTGVIGTALLVLALCGGIAAVAWEAHVARLERARAEHRFDDVRKLANSYLFEFHDAIENLPGSTPVRQLLVKRALEYLDSLSRESGNDPTIKRELATAYEKVGDVEGKPGSPNLGNSKAARDSYSKALAIRESLVAANPGSFEDRLALDNTYFNVGKMQESAGDLTAALATSQKALALSESLESMSGGNPRPRTLRAMTLDTIGDLQDGLDVSTHFGDASASLEYHKKARSVYQELLRTEPGSVDIRRRLSICNLKIGDAMAKRGDTHAALTEYRKSLADFSQLAGTTGNTKLRRNIAAVYYRIGLALDAQGDIPGSFENYTRGLTISRDMSAADPKNERVRMDVAYGLLDVGESAAKMGRVESGLVTLRQAISTLEGLNSSDPDNAEIQGTLVLAYESISKFLTKHARTQDRLDYLTQGWKLANHMLATDARNIDARSKAIGFANEIGSLYTMENQSAKALEMYRAGTSLAEPLLRPGSKPSMLLAQCFAGAGRAAFALAARLPPGSGEKSGTCRDAAAAFQKSVQLFSDLVRSGALKGAAAAEPAKVARELGQVQASCQVTEAK